MLKGNLIVGKNQSVVLHADSLQDLLKLAESKSVGQLSIRVDLEQSDLHLDMVLDGSLNANEAVAPAIISQQ